jgi:peroxiredoxin (alkyl hydroperoxide reductase subunit C)
MRKRRMFDLPLYAYIRIYGFIQDSKEMNMTDQSVSLPRINEPAPAFKVKTTQGDRSLADYNGKWLILFSHPADFTPVCTTEFIAFAKAADRFKALNCELLGLSIDSVFAHLAWVRNIKEKFGVEIPFPIIEDLKMEVAQAYGMIHPGAGDTSAVRATFVIDPEGKIRAMVYYPMSNGRSVDEFVRLLQGLQTADKYGVATPENWHPGEPVIVPPPKTDAEADARAGAGYEYTDWYFSKKKLVV